ncbi:NAD(P)/FAD-dependent oxidoreductase [Chitinophaga sp.]|uniref:flavin monoamine oxidase family protein n=1 Tax=Chitinophaga sp. TaxID=1869181 RepID=UPI002B760552|nr:NAD(P)/FAD-dependent oxidoreductase [Chitinophaga sp.]HWV66645.1 NAD(P)/FAD-dependent oxidoreductase [Chitinophaga sp.]
MEKFSVAIIGGGLSGLLLANLLQKKNIDTIVLEASDRLGGRIHTIQAHRPGAAPLELGATWFADMHQQLVQLISELNIERFPQYAAGISLFQTKSFEPPQAFYVPESSEPSYRIAGGTSALIEALRLSLLPGSVYTGRRVTAITGLSAGVRITTADAQVFEADQVVVCLPPQLAGKTITIHPALPEAVAGVINTVHTWMEGTVKFTIEYASAFWRSKGFSGMLYSHAGIITEMYDHTNAAGTAFALTGFLGGAAGSYSPATRKDLVIKQLTELLGPDAGEMLHYEDKVWNDAFISSGSNTLLMPHQNNGHPLLQQSYLDGKLWFCGTETAAKYGGYMEGAVMAAKTMADKF